MTKTLPAPAAKRNAGSVRKRPARNADPARFAPTHGADAYVVQNARCARAHCGGDVLFDPATKRITCPACARRAAPPAAEKLLAMMLSAGGRAVLAVIAAGTGTTAKQAALKAKLERTAAYRVLADLNARGLVADHGDGFVLTPDGAAVWAAVAPAEGGDL